ncbi:hypothetical protein D3C86_1385340 [compost metagenome]
MKENLTSSQKRDESFIKLENNGVIARNDRLKAQLQTSNIELQLMEAENNYSIANINMDLLLGLPDNTEIEVDSNYIGEDDLGKPDDYYLNLARENRNDIKALDYQRKAAALGSSRHSKTFDHHKCCECWRWNPIQPFEYLEEKFKLRPVKSQRTGIGRE